MAVPVEVLSLVRARIALSGRFLHRSELHALVLGGLREEGAGLLFGSGLADAEHDVGEGNGGRGPTSSWTAKPSPGRIVRAAGHAARAHQPWAQQTKPKISRGASRPGRTIFSAF